MERAYLDLRLVRGQLDLQGRLESLWQQAEEIARARYQVGEVPQSDLLRAQLERTRLRRQRLALEAAERSSVQEVNRLRVHPLDEAVDTPVPLTEARPGPLPAPEVLLADAEARSPDLALASRSRRRPPSLQTDRGKIQSALLALPPALFVEASELVEIQSRADILGRRSRKGILLE